MTGGVVALLCSWGASVQMAFVLSRTSGGEPLHWPVSEISFVIAAGGAARIAADESGLEFVALRKVFNTWEAVARSRLRFRYQGRVDDASAIESGDGLAGVRFFSGSVPADLGDAIGVTLISYDDSTGTIFDADILFNERDFRFSVVPRPGTIDLESVALHEAGHLVGLDHTCGAFGEVQPSCYDASLPARSDYPVIVGAVMYPLRGIGDPTLRSPTADDVDGIATLYPASPEEPAPSPTSLVATVGGAALGITVNGTNFAAGATLRLFLDSVLDRQTTVTEVQTGRLTATVDTASLVPGCYDAIVSNPGGKQGVLFGAFTFGGALCPAPNAGSGCSVAGPGAPFPSWFALAWLAIAAIAVRRYR